MASDISNVVPVSRQPEQGEALLAAVAQGNLEEVKRLLASGADARYRRPFGDPALVTACHLGTRKNPLGIVTALVEAGADVNDGWLSLPLEAALMRGNLEVAEYLVSHGADVNAVIVDYESNFNRSGEILSRKTLLEKARFCNRQRMAEFLIRHGATEARITG